VVVASVASSADFGASSVALLLWQFSIAPVIGYLTGRGAVALYNRLVPEDRGYYYLLFLAAGLLTFGLADLVRGSGSGMLAVFTTGFVMGNRPFVHKQGVRNFSEALSTISNIGLFVMLGLLVFPHQWSGVWLEGTLLFLVLPKGNTRVQSWDQVTILAHAPDSDEIRRKILRACEKAGERE
jgi:cell volume regulation protein A